VFVGFAVFRLIHESRQIQNEQIFIEQDHRRRSIGNALYVVAKRLSGYEVIPGANQTEDGRAFWNQPNRPF
jgi:hypothetical protein